MLFMNRSFGMGWRRRGTWRRPMIRRGPGCLGLVLVIVLIIALFAFLRGRG